MHQAWSIYEIWEHIAAHLGKQDLARLASCCRYLYELAAAQLWKKVSNPNAFLVHVPADLDVTAVYVAKVDRCWSRIQEVDLDDLEHRLVAWVACPPAFQHHPGSWTQLCQQIAALRPPSLAFHKLDSVRLIYSRPQYILPLIGIRAPCSITLKINWRVRQSGSILKRFLRSLQEPWRLEHLDVEEEDTQLVPFTLLTHIKSLRLAFDSIQGVHAWRVTSHPGFRAYHERLKAADLAISDHQIFALLDEVYGQKYNDSRRADMLFEQLEEADGIQGKHLAHILSVGGWDTLQSTMLFAFNSTMVLSVIMPRLQRLELVTTPHFLHEYSPDKYAAFAESLPVLTHLTFGREVAFSCFHEWPTFYRHDFSPPLHHLALFCSMLPIRTLVNWCWMELPGTRTGVAAVNVLTLMLRIIRPEREDQRRVAVRMRELLSTSFPESDLCRMLTSEKEVTGLVTCRHNAWPQPTGRKLGAQWILRLRGENQDLARSWAGKYYQCRG